MHVHHLCFSRLCFAVIWQLHCDLFIFLSISGYDDTAASRVKVEIQILLHNVSMKMMFVDADAYPLRLISSF